MRFGALSHSNSLFSPSGPSLVSGAVVNLNTAPSSGSTWTDTTGNGYNGTLNGTYTYTASNGGGIITTVAGTSYISVNYNFVAPFTVSVLATFNISTYWGSIWGSEAYGPQKGYLAYISDDNTLNFGSPNGVGTVTVSGINTSGPNLWDFTVDASNNGTIYQNGTSIYTGTITAPKNGIAAGGTFFGARHVNNSSSPRSEEHTSELQSH